MDDDEDEVEVKDCTECGTSFPADEDFCRTCGHFRSDD